MFLSNTTRRPVAVALAVACVALVALGAAMYFWMPRAPHPAPMTPVASSTVATSTATSTPAPEPVTTKPTAPKPVTPPKATPAAPHVPTPPPSTPHVPQSTPTTVSNPSVPTTAGELRAAAIPLLAGGTANLGSTVPVFYLQVENQSTTTATIRGFRLQQGGTAPDADVTGVSAVDEEGMPAGAAGGGEGMTPFTDRSAYLPSSATLAPGQRKLFTIKARVSATATQGTLALVVSGIDANVPARAVFPIRGTTWVIGQ